MAARKRVEPKLRKVVDESLSVRSKSGALGVLREEVWVDPEDKVAKYNLAYINFHLYQGDNGRVLGYDNAHGHHERHHRGKVERSSFSTYEAKAKIFYAEVQRLRSRS